MCPCVAGCVSRNVASVVHAGAMVKSVPGAARGGGGRVCVCLCVSVSVCECVSVCWRGWGRLRSQLRAMERRGRLELSFKRVFLSCAELTERKITPSQSWMSLNLSKLVSDLLHSLGGGV